MPERPGLLAGVGLATLTWLLIMFLVIEGVTKMVLALTVRPLANWGWLLTSGIIGVLLALYLFNSPVTAVWLVGLLIGIQFMSEGLALGLIAWEARQVREPGA